MVGLPLGTISWYGGGKKIDGFRIDFLKEKKGIDSIQAFLIASYIYTLIPVYMSP